MLKLVILIISRILPVNVWKVLDLLILGIGCWYSVIPLRWCRILLNGCTIVEVVYLCMIVVEIFDNHWLLYDYSGLIASLISRSTRLALSSLRIIGRSRSAIIIITTQYIAHLLSLKMDYRLLNLLRVFKTLF